MPQNNHCITDDAHTNSTAQPRLDAIDIFCAGILPGKGTERGTQRIADLHARPLHLQTYTVCHNKCRAICIDDRLQRHIPLYFEQGLTLHDEIADDVWVKGSPTHLKQVLDILLDNALK